MLNHITIMGRLVRDPELRKTGSGVSVASFTVAVDRDFAKDGEKKTDFIDCVAWRQAGEFIAKYFTKGRMIVVDGHLEIREWTDKEGNKRRNAEVIVANAYFGDSKRSDQGDSTYQNQYGSTSQNPYAETEALIARYSAQGASNSEFAMLEDNDPQLPF